LRDSQGGGSEISLVVFRVVFYFSSVYFLLMGIMLMVFPRLLTRSAGLQSPIILGMLRGAGGSIIPYSLLYALVAMKPKERRWAAAIIAVANVAALSLDLISVLLKEYSLSYAMIDIPIELLSLLVVLWFYSPQNSQPRAEKSVCR
jgi:hypothetical protein